MNVDMDKIECESCGTHLIFNALTSWSPVEGMFCLDTLLFSDKFTAMLSGWLLCVAVLQVTFLCSATNCKGGPVEISACHVLILYFERSPIIF